MPWQAILVGVIVIAAAAFVVRNLRCQIQGAPGGGADFAEPEGCDRCPVAKGRQVR